MQCFGIALDLPGGNISQPDNREFTNSYLSAAQCLLIQIFRAAFQKAALHPEGVVICAPRLSTTKQNTVRCLLAGRFRAWLEMLV
jgi:hypothetical protein